MNYSGEEILFTGVRQSLSISSPTPSQHVVEYTTWQLRGTWVCPAPLALPPPTRYLPVTLRTECQDSVFPPLYLAKVSSEMVVL